MFNLFKRRAEYQAYAKTVDDCLRVLFAEFPEGTLQRLRFTLNIEAVTRGMFKGKSTTAKQCGVMIARTLLGTFFESLLAKEKQAAAVAFDARDLGHPLFYGLAAMDHVARQLVDDMHGRMLLYEAAGRLKGMSREEIDNSWGQNEVNRIADAMRGEGQSPPPSAGLEGMGQWLDRRLTAEETEKQQEEDRRNNLRALWVRFRPVVMQAVELVNAKLADHSRMHLISSEPDFFGRDYSGYGVVCTLMGENDIKVPLAVTDDSLYVAGAYTWSEGQKIALDGLTVETLADEIADGLKGLLDW